jgi:hypothetical protein
MLAMIWVIASPRVPGVDTTEAVSIKYAFVHIIPFRK